MKGCKILAIIFSVIALIGLVRFVGEMTLVNAGVFIFPAIVAVIFALAAILQLILSDLLAFMMIIMSCVFYKNTKKSK